MNIFEMLKFDIGEFISSPAGLMMILGIVFLVVGIVLLCMGRGKNGTEEKESTTTVDDKASDSKEAPVAVENTIEVKKEEITQRL